MLGRADVPQHAEPSTAPIVRERKESGCCGEEDDGVVAEVRPVFLALVPRPGPPVDAILTSSSVKATVIRAGADPDDPGAARVLSEDVNGNLHVEEVLPSGGDVVTAMREMVPTLVVPVRNLRAMQGN